MKLNDIHRIANKLELEEFEDVVQDTIISNLESVERIIRLVEYVSGIARELIFSETRVQELAAARHTIMYLIRKNTKLGLVNIGALTNRDHSSVHYAVKRVESAIKSKGKNDPLIWDYKSLF